MITARQSDKNVLLTRFSTFQAICNADMEFIDIVTKFQGSAHDSYVLRQSNIYQRFESGEFGDSILLGDSGYAQKTWLMTPFEEPHVGPEMGYNTSHKSTRNAVER